MESMWEPSNEIEHRLREALRADDQDGYFRILSQIELVLPLSYEDSAGLGGADTWATWTTDDRTHILAFTSESALGQCLRDNAGASRRVGFATLAESWPDEEWWLAVNPGLPIEGYLPAWFVSQVAQGMTTVPAEPEPEADHYGTDQTFATLAQSDPFANPMAPAAPAREGSFMPPAPPVPEVPPAPRRSKDLNNTTGQQSTIAGTTSAGLPLRQPPQVESELAAEADGLATPPVSPPAAPHGDGFAPQSAPQDGFADQRFASPPTGDQRFASPPPANGFSDQRFASPPPSDGFSDQRFASPPLENRPPEQGFSGQSFASPPLEGRRPEPGHGEQQSAWPAEQTQWPDAPDWLRDQQPDGMGELSQRAPAATDLPSDPQPDQSSTFGAPAEPGLATGAPSAESFTSMSSAFGRRPAEPAPAEAPEPEPQRAAQQVVELTGEDAERALAAAATSGDTATFLQTLLCTSVILPVADPGAIAIRVGDPAFRWASDIVDGIHGITMYTTIERMADRVGPDTPHTTVPFGWLIQHWPGVEYALYVNPGTEVGANMSGPEIEPLLKWAESQDLLAFATEMERHQAAAVRAADPASVVAPILWQKTIPHQQVPFYLERGYDRVGGFIHPAEAVDHLRTPAQLYLALGLIRTSEEFSPTDDSVHVLRWTGYRTDLYPAAVGGNDAAGAEARGGWVVEPGPFRGDGFAPSESPEDRIPEHKVDSVRLPQGAQILRIDSRGEVTELAVYDADTREWAPADGGGPRAIEASSVPALPAGPSAETPPAGPMGEAAPGYDEGYEGSALGEAFGGDAGGHYDLVRPAPEDRAASVLDHRDREWKGA
ncbi:SseB family protein [Glycomyces buryatensis]|uniref:SseB protein N-terminal domain-containing protein n=1 Tax=Glycomyces buryatensis TaxID=2570927 RepID=A0A4S8QGL8_9ACTN|nr:SseB family protein [Glycomyces buryatensis]THV42322.1 hypothetical protein FAB82_06600 [Glycomyces buryatensis]